MSYMDPVNQLPFAVSEGLGVPMPTPERPTLPGPAPGPFGMNPQVADMLAQAIYGSLQGMGPINPHARQADQFGQAFLRSALGAVAAPRVQAMGERKAEQQRIHEANLKATEDYRKQIGEAGKQLREHRFKLAEIDAQNAAKPKPQPKDAEAEAYGRELGALRARKAMGIDITRQSTSGASESDAAAIADAIVSGNQPPDMTGMYRYGAPVRAELSRRGYDLTRAQTDWKATQRWLSTANGPQQIRMRQAAQTAYESLDVIDDLSARLSKVMPRGSVKVLNKAAVAAAMNGAFGQEAQNLATQLNAQITDVTSELGNVYMGGNSPTDHALKLAAQNLSGSWSLSQLKAGTDLARKNLTIRINSMNTAGVVSPSNPVTTSPSTGTNIGNRRLGNAKPGSNWFEANKP